MKGSLFNINIIFKFLYKTLKKFLVINPTMTTNPFAWTKIRGLEGSSSYSKVCKNNRIWQYKDNSNSSCYPKQNILSIDIWFLALIRVGIFGSDDNEQEVDDDKANKIELIKIKFRIIEHTASKVT